MKIRFRLPLIWALTLLFLSGCAAVQNSTTNVEWQTHQQRLASISHYQAVGKIGYISPDQRQSLNFQWKHSPQNSELRLSTFLGQTVLNLSVTPKGAVVETYDDQTLTADDADTLIYQLTGLAIPFKDLNHWLLGEPGNVEHFTTNAHNTLASLSKTLESRTWQLDYLNYRDEPFNGLPLPLPQKLKLQQASTKINIIVSKWTLTQ
ncbi:lipoprotein insertase outer membrane protein LolB [Vibrio sp. TRT 17S01]|uniref:lipoprotein insertase outer membrane protein LolB n=1 Tax=Vibrio sp. TRT 17S01 TaxID=3418505 RepID=UPI003CF954E8